MSVYTLSLATATGTAVTGASAGTIASAALVMPMNITTFAGTGIAALMNFSGAGVGYTSSAAVGNVTLQVSNDPNANPTGASSAQATARWNNHDTLVNRTTDQNSSIVYPCRYVRLIGSVTSGTITCFLNAPDASNPAT